MRKTNLVKFLIIGLIFALIIFTGNVYVNAASSDDSDYNDMTAQLMGSGNSNSNSNNSNRNTNNTNTNRANNNNSANNTNRTNNTNLYANENNLPSTGIEDSMPTVLLIVVFGISAIYAYKKISDYKNL